MKGRITTTLLALSSLFFVSAANAQSLLNIATDRFNSIGQKSGLSAGNGAVSPFDVIGSLLYVVLGTVGVIFVIVTIQGGFLWMTAGGNEDQVNRARQKITNGVIGVVIIFAAYLLTSFILNQICGISLFGVTCGGN